MSSNLTSTIKMKNSTKVFIQYYLGLALIAIALIFSNKDNLTIFGYVIFCFLAVRIFFIPFFHLMETKNSVDTILGISNAIVFNLLTVIFAFIFIYFFITNAGIKTLSTLLFIFLASLDTAFAARKK